MYTLLLACLLPPVSLTCIVIWARQKAKLGSLSEELSLNKNLRIFFAVISIISFLAIIPFACSMADGPGSMSSDTQVSVLTFIGMTTTASFFCWGILSTSQGTLRCPNCQKAQQGNFKKLPYVVTDSEISQNTNGIEVKESRKVTLTCSYCSYSWDKEYESTSLISKPQPQQHSYGPKPSYELSRKELQEMWKEHRENLVNQQKADFAKSLSERYSKEDVKKILEDFPKVNFPPVSMPKIEIKPLPPMPEFKPPKIEPFDPDKYR